MRYTVLRLALKVKGFLKNLFRKTADWLCTDIASVLLLIFAAVISKHSFLLNRQFLPGWDGYFYLEQLSRWMEKGALHSFDPSLFYPYLYCLTRLTGSYEAGYLWGIFLSIALLSVIVYLCGRLLRVSRFISFSAALVVQFSFFSQYMAYQFPKNFFSVIFLVLSAAFALRSYLPLHSEPIEKIKFRFFFSSAVIFALLSLFTHRQGGVLAFLFIGALFLSERFSLMRPRRFALTAVLLFAAYVVFFIGKSYFAPVAFLRQFPDIRFSWCVETVILVFASLVLPVAAVRSRKRIGIPVILFLFVGFLPVSDYSPQSLSFRFFLTLMVVLPALLLFSVSFVGKYAVVSLCGVIIALSIFFPVSFNRYDPPYAYLNSLCKKIAVNKKIIDAPLVIAGKPLSEFAGYLLRKDCMAWRADSASDETTAVRIAWGVENSEYRYYIGSNADSIDMLGGNYSVISEPLWQEFCRTVYAKNDAYLISIVSDFKNPHEQRPRYLALRKRLFSFFRK